jgi:hypothetical protein
MFDPASTSIPGRKPIDMSWKQKMEMAHIAPTEIVAGSTAVWQARLCNIRLGGF